MRIAKNSRIALLALGAPLSVVLPLITAVSCGTNNSVKHYKLLPTYTGQADQLIALGIKADYYPLQLDKSAPFDYLLHPANYMYGQDDAFRNAFTKKIQSLIPHDKGTSWWNLQASEDGEHSFVPEYWTHRGGDLVLYEHYLLDDGQKVVRDSQAPKHYDTPATFIQTNFRQSRDPFTRIPEKIVRALFDQQDYDALVSSSNPDDQDALNFIKLMLKTARDVEKLDLTGPRAVDGDYMPNGILKQDTADLQDGPSWIYNDFTFARKWHLNYLDNTQFTSSDFQKWVIDSRTSWAFDDNQTNNSAIAKLFYASTYRDSEKSLANMMGVSSNPQIGASILNHHPIYDQQTELGGAPMFEGAMRDNMLYLYDLSSKVQKAATDKTQSGYDILEKAFADPASANNWNKMQHALDNANLISQNIHQRMLAIKKLVDQMNNPVFGIVTLAPGAGVSTIQSASKYSFLYRELGFKQPVPDNLGAITKDAATVKQNAANGGDKTTSDPTASRGNTFFNMDDNGWWWNVSQQDGDGKAIGISATATGHFAHQLDYGVLTSDDKQFANLKDPDRVALKQLWKNTSINLDQTRVNYDLWNEGIKTPFVMHMVLDKIVDMIKDNAKLAGSSDADIAAAQDWGSYFTHDFVA